MIGQLSGIQRAAIATIAIAISATATAQVIFGEPTPAPSSGSRPTRGGPHQAAATEPASQRTAYPVELSSGATVWIRNANARMGYLYDGSVRIPGKDYSVSALVEAQTGLEIADLVRRDLGKFVIKKTDPILPKPLASGAIVSFTIAGIIAIRADPDFDSRMVRMDNLHQMTTLETSLQISKRDLQTGWALHAGDRFFLRSLKGDGWLTLNCPSRIANEVCLTASRTDATEWLFETSPPPSAPFVNIPSDLLGPPAGRTGTTAQVPPPRGWSQPSAADNGRPYICFSDRDLNFAGCKGRYGYVCSNSSRAHQVTVSYDEASGNGVMTLSNTYSVPANASIGSGAPELPGGSQFAPNSFAAPAVCRNRNWTITAVD